jgi:hypothetical protein
MPRETQTAINTAQPTDVLTAQPNNGRELQPNHGRVLTETVQPQGPAEASQVPPLISGVAPPETQTAAESDTAVPIDEGRS